MTPENPNAGNSKKSTGSNKLLLHIGAIATIVAWGSSFVMTKVIIDNGNDSLTPTEAYVYRILLAYILMVLLSHKKLMCRTTRDELTMLVAGMCAGSVYFIAENYALQYTLVSNVSLITTTSPLLTALLLGLVYKNEKPTRGILIGSLIALTGVGLVIFNSSFSLEINPLGDLLALGAAMSWAIYSIVLRRVFVTYDIMFITRKMFFYGFSTALIFMLVMHEPTHLHALAQTKVWVNLVGLGVVCSVLAFIVWNIAIKRLGTVTTSNYLYFQPVVTLIVAAVVLGEVITWIGYTGCALILLGVVASDLLDKSSAANFFKIKRK